MSKSEPITTFRPNLLQFKYDAVKMLIAEEEEKIAGLDIDIFKSIIDQVQNLHQFVRGPREQIPDAEALLSITSSLLTGVKLHSNGFVNGCEVALRLQIRFSGLAVHEVFRC